MRSIPRDPAFDGTARLLREGYTFVATGCDRTASDVFRTRLALKPTICLRGRDAAALFYDEDRFSRQGAAPRRLRKTLLGEGGVQGLDDAAHKHRKRLFLDLLTDERVAELGARFEHTLGAAAARWATQGRVVLHGEVHRALTRAVCDWAGVPLPEGELSARSRDLRALVTGGGRFGPGYLRGRLARIRAEAWAAGLIREVRAGRLRTHDSALFRIAVHRERDGELLPAEAAAVELLNVLRPTAAVAWFVSFAAHALHHHPAWVDRVRGDDAALAPFAQEVRRFYPFFPFAVARTRAPFVWRGLRFPADTRTLLDLYGIDRDPRLWEDPTAFRPDRFRPDHAATASGGREPFDFVPQGGGIAERHHRCPGERVALELVARAVAFLTRAVAYDVPDQDWSIPLATMPTRPASGVVLERVRRVALGQSAAAAMYISA